MDKGIKIYITVISLVTAAAIIVGCFIFITGRLSFGKKMGVAVSNEVAIEGEITSLEIDMDAVEVRIETGNEPYVSYNVADTEVPEIKEENGKLSIISPKGRNIGFPGVAIHPSLEVVLAEGTDLESLNMKIDAGNVNLDRLKATDAKLKLDAGNLDIDELEAQTLSVEVDAGNVDVDESNIGTLQVSVDAGNIDVDDSTVKQGECKADVGNISLDGDIGDVKVKTDIGKTSVH